MVMMRDLIIIIIISMMYLVVEPVFNRLHKLHVARSRPSLTVTSLSLSAPTQRLAVELRRCELDGGSSPLSPLTLTKEGRQ